MSQRILQLSVSEPIDPADYFDPPKTTKFATLEVDLVRDTVKLPGGFVCRLAGLTQVLNQALSAQKRLEQERAFDEKRLMEGFYR